jgi:hypothetical protein
MARKYAQISLDVWADEEFRALSHGAQWLYWLLISQPTLTAAGALPLQERRWAKLAADTGRTDIEHLLKELDAARYVLVDDDTEELLIRSYLRNGQGWRQPNLAKTAMEQARQIISPRLRAAMVDELCRIPFGELSGARSDMTRALARETIAALSPKGSAPRPVWDGGTHDGTHAGRDTATHSPRDGGRDAPVTHSPSHSESADQPIAEPIDLTCGTGTGTGTGTTSVDGCSLSETRETNQTTDPTHALVLDATDARPDEAPVLLDRIRAELKPRSLPALLRTMGANGDLQALLDDTRTRTTGPRVRPKDEWMHRQ